MNKKIILISLISLSIFIGGCNSKTMINNTSTSKGASNKGQQASQEITNQNAEVSQSANNSDKTNALNFEIITKTYENKKVKINYPQITNLSDVNKQKQINDLIKNDILTYFNVEREDLTIDANYEIKWKSSRLLSIVYKGYSNIKTSMHPDNNIYATNINIENGAILKFKDLINLDNNFAEKLKNVKSRVWTPEPLDGIDDKTAISLIGEELSWSTNKDLINYFNSDAFNYCGYFTKDYFGIGIAINHAAGDYAELKIKYGDIKDNIKPENEVWKDFINNTKTEDKVKVKEESKKQEYKTKLDNIEIALESLKEKDAGTTLDMREAASERLTQWDAALNEIYNVLKGQLSSADMKKLQSEETQWISNRDAKAKKESLEVKGGTMEPLIYTSSLQDTTKNRCYELVEKYMK
ncbi:lysozyme inhibitor LprI family protein [Clostridium sp.]|uniref:lysozyme inhibitor LprI family protein n=1 Tax=Clostridium sp. TaxID=1506 RepID=UPI003D6D5995